MKIIALILLIFFSSSSAIADRFYDKKIVYFPEIEEVAFYYGAISPQSDMIIKRALLSEPQTKTMVLISLGGSSYGGLRAGYLIHQAGLNTFVPIGSVCASACSDLFFAGKNRWVEGALGVHQFRSGQDDVEILAAIKETQSVTQYEIADILAYYGDYDLPAFVSNRMLTTHWSDMYYFDASEKEDLMQKNTQVLPKNKTCIEKFTNYIYEIVILDNQEVTRPVCKDVDTSEDEVHRTAPSSGQITAPLSNHEFNLLECSGELSDYLKLGSIILSPQRRSFNGRNISIKKDSGEELLFGNPRLYSTNSGDLISEISSENMLVAGKFETITLALIADEQLSTFSELRIVSEDKKTICGLK